MVGHRDEDRRVGDRFIAKNKNSGSRAHRETGHDCSQVTPTRYGHNSCETGRQLPTYVYGSLVMLGCISSRVFDFSVVRAANSAMVTAASS